MNRARLRCIYLRRGVSLDRGSVPLPRVRGSAGRHL